MSGEPTAGDVRHWVDGEWTYRNPLAQDDRALETLVLHLRFDHKMTYKAIAQRVDFTYARIKEICTAFQEEWE